MKMEARREFIHLLQSRMDAENITKALEAFDVIAARYNITAAETSLTAPNPADEPILAYYIESSRLDGLRESTLRNKASHIRDFLQAVNTPVRQITPLHCRAYMATVAERKGTKGEKITAGTYNFVRSSLSSFFEWCVREELLDKNPMANVRRKKATREVKKSCTDYEVEQLRRAAATEQERLMIEVMFGTGCRISELRLLKAEDFDFRSGRVLLYGVKTDEYRESITNGRMEAAFDEFIKAKKNKSPYLFASERRAAIEQTVSTKALENTFYRICARAGIKRRIHPHDTRRTFATELAAGGTDLLTVQRLLGHKRLDTTQTYLDTNSIELGSNIRHAAGG